MIRESGHQISKESHYNVIKQPHFISPFCLFSGFAEPILPFPFAITRNFNNFPFISFSNIERQPFSRS